VIPSWQSFQLPVYVYSVCNPFNFQCMFTARGASAMTSHITWWGLEEFYERDISYYSPINIR
jgi:hypothetical protein